MTSSAETLPILDFSRFDAGESERAAFLKDLREAARGPGFFYLTGHGVPQPLIDEVLKLSRRFFDLPEADKLAIEMINSPHFRGYNRAGFEHTRGKPDWREQVDISAEKRARPLDPAAPAWHRLHGPNQWPEALPELQLTTLRYLREVTGLGVRVLSAFALALGQKADAFEPIYTPEPNQLLKIVRYPGRDASEGDQGVGAHKDSGFLTLLLQDVQGGLQVEGEHGWIAAPPIPGTFVVNIGEILELASNGYLRANVHRVVSPPAGTDRLSVPFFLGAQLDAEVPMLALAPELAAEARGLTQDPLNPLFREVGRNYLKSRLRSHPDVARRHHPDLVDTSKPVQIASAY
ncbi:isopenicillin N synthase family dioxygenase [Labrys neptuniae]